jgi:shikimate dehydrogenase
VSTPLGALDQRRFDGHTRLAAVIGSPVRHSLSPAIHNAAFAALGLNWVYVAFEVAEGKAPAALAAMRALGIAGLSVTMPHKAAVAAAVDRLSPAAARLGAVNCVVAEGDELVGHNTDGGGFIDALRAESDFDPAGREVAVRGAGGAARAVVAALADAAVGRVVVVNRTPERAAAAAQLGGGRAVVGTQKDITDCDLVVNATSVGMGRRAEGAGAADIADDPRSLRAGQVVVDLVYQPLDTPLVAVARSRGAAAHNGVGMLVHQAARAFRLWTGEPPPLDAMRSVVLSSIDR